MQVDTLTIVGVGLIGASVGCATRRHHLARRVIGIDRAPEVAARALAIGALDEVDLQLGPAVAMADLVLFATPVDQIVDAVLEAASACRPDTLLTDVGSAKARIVRDVEAGGWPVTCFVGGHPLAGSEKRGPEHADPDLFQGRVVVLTPTERTDVRALGKVSSFWESLGARVRIMDAAEHDWAVAFVSHLPHLAAAALIRAVPEKAAGMAATGFRDTTRVAAGDPALWAGILVQNRDPVLGALSGLRDQLGTWADCLREGDRRALENLLAEAKRARDALGD